MDPRGFELLNEVNRGYFNPMNDALFKFLLGKEEGKRLTINFLNSVLGPQLEKPIEDLTFLSTENFPEQFAGKETPV